MEHGFDVADPSVNVFEQVERRQLSEQIHTALHKLTDKQRTVVSLYFFDGLNFREIGERLHIGTSAVFDHYSAAIKKLKKVFGKYLKTALSRGFYVKGCGSISI